MAPRRDHDDRHPIQFWVTSERKREFCAVHDGHLIVGEHGVWGLVACRFEGLTPVSKRADTMPPAPENSTQHR